MIVTMRLKNRFLIVGLGILIFLIITPLLVLFARGFKIDFKERRLIKTGTLVVTTEPEKADIFLNDKFHDDTPSSIRFLLPGDYTVRLEKKGYQSWTKRLSIKSQFATWTNADREFVTLFLADPIEQPNQIDIAKLKEELYPPSEKIWQILGNQLVRVHPETSQPEIILAELPQHNAHEIIEAESHLFILLDKTLYILNEKLEKIYEPVITAHWDTQASKLVLQNNNEILLFEPFSASPDLILRSISEIKNAKLNWGTGYVFFQNEGKIKAVELDGRDHRNIYTLTDALDDFLISKEGKELYVFDQQETKVYKIR